MSRGNVFKLSGNMALGGGDYGSTDIEEIKNSLKLLKAKKNQRQSAEQPPNNYGYSANSIPSKNYIAQKADYNYQSLAKNHMPNSQKDVNYDYSKKNYNNDYVDVRALNNKKSNDQYDYSNKPPSYPSQSNTRNRNIQSLQQTQNYEDHPSYSGKNYGKNSTPQTKTSEQNSYQKNNYNQQKQNSNSNKVQPKEQYYNDKEERSIRQVNRENQIDIVEYDPSELRPCRVCGRKFNPNSIRKHEQNCKQVFQKKRKEYNAQEHRMVDNQQKKLMKRGEIIQQKLEAQQKNQKIPKWKAESLAFRAVLKQNRNQSIDPRQAAIIQQAQNQTGVKCPHCGRKFNETAGPRHIKFCEEQTKKNMMKKKK